MKREIKAGGSANGVKCRRRRGGSESAKRRGVAKAAASMASEICLKAGEKSHQAGGEAKAKKMKRRREDQ